MPPSNVPAQYNTQDQIFVSQLFAPCMHPLRAGRFRRYYATMVLPLLIMRKQMERGCIVCYCCYHGHELDNPNGPGVEVGGNRFKRLCRHYKYCHNARCNPHATRILERSQQIAVRIYNEIMERGSDDNRYAVRLLLQVGIQSILDDNRFGFRPQGTILEGRLDPTVQTRNLHDRIWNVMEAALRATYKFVEQPINILSRGLDFCRVLYGLDFTDLSILIFCLCKKCGYCPITDFDGWVIANGRLKGWYCVHCGFK